VHLDVMLCNYAEVQNNLLYVSGAGIERSFVPPGAPPPFGLQLALAMIVTVPWEGTDADHQLHLELLDEAGQVVTVPMGPEQVGSVTADIQFRAPRPPGAEPGDDVRISLAASMAGLPLEKLGLYQWVFSVDGDEVRRVPYRLGILPGQLAGPPQPAPAPRGGGAASPGFLGG
jgi:hypothetical protein